MSKPAHVGKGIRPLSAPLGAAQGDRHRPKPEALGLVSGVAVEKLGSMLREAASPDGSQRQGAVERGGLGGGAGKAGGSRAGGGGDTLLVSELRKSRAALEA